MAGFPKILNHGKAAIFNGRISFSYLDSQSRAIHSTKPILTSRQIADRIKKREIRFDESAENSRESDDSRAERKYLAAHPRATLILARRLLDVVGKEEFDTMFDGNSHNGISDPKWVKENARNRDMVYGDDEKPL